MSLLTDNLRRARSLGVSFKAALIMLILSFISILFEGVGIVMLLPIFDYVQHNGDVDKLLQQNGYWAYMSIRSIGSTFRSLCRRCSRSVSLPSWRGRFSRSCVSAIAPRFYLVRSTIFGSELST